MICIRLYKENIKILSANHKTYLWHIKTFRKAASHFCLNSFLASGDFCRLLIWMQTVWLSDSFPQRIFWKTSQFWKKSADDNKIMKKYPACIEFFCLLKECGDWRHMMLLDADSGPDLDANCLTVIFAWAPFFPLQKAIRFNSFLASGDFCRLLITFANSLDPDQDRQNVGPDLDANCLTLW